jgi:transcriptional regulator with XRE-family HTH domain
MDSAREAANLCFEDESVGIAQENLKFEVDFSQFFQYYGVINTKVLADKIGMNHNLLSQYVQGRRKASEKQTKKILYAIRLFGQDLSEINHLS